MSASNAGALVAEPDEPFWNRPITLNFASFFSGLAKATLFGTVQKWDDAAAAAVEALSAARINRTPAQLAGLLIQRSALRAVYTLLRDYLRDFSSELPADLAAMCDSHELDLTSHPVVLDASFFERPGDLELVSRLQKKLESFLSLRVVGVHHPPAIAARLPHYFVWALHREVQEQVIDYSLLIAAVNTPFVEAWRKTRTWELYQAEFRKQLAEPVLGEGFSLPQIFLWPRAYYDVNNSKTVKKAAITQIEPTEVDDVEPRSRFVVDLKQYLDVWLDNEEGLSDEHRRHDAIRLISGDPGSGKSSFVKIYAEYRMRRGDKVLFVPLHKLNVQGEFGAELNNFCNERDDCPSGLLDSATAERRLILVLDGLDELSKQGAIGATIASSFVEEVVRKTNSRNERDLRLNVLVSGRPIAVQNIADKFRKEGVILHLLPYFVDVRKEQDSRHEAAKFVGRTELLKIDMRHDWWRTFGKCTGKTFDEMPEDLARSELDDLTVQPLLNYLVALVYVHDDPAADSAKRINFKGDVNTNQIYDVLLDRMYARDWDVAKGHKALHGISIEEFRALLEEMALTAWHGRDRTTTVAALRSQCERSNLREVLRKYEIHCDDGVGSLFTAFYFKKSDRVDGPEPTFEFTHKSFGEYLAALRIVDTIRDIAEQLVASSRKLVGVFTIRDAALQWLAVFGPKEISLDLSEYVRNEVVLRLKAIGHDAVMSWQATAMQLLEYVLVSGLPCEMERGLTYSEMYRRSRNAEEALLVVHSACASATNQISQVKWPHGSSAGELICRIRGQRTGVANCSGMMSLNHIVFRMQHLAFADLYRANLSYSVFRGCEYYSAMFYGAQLKGADFSDEILNCLDLGNANLRGAKLKNVRINLCAEEDAVTRAVRLDDADISGADVEGMRLIHVGDSETCNGVVPGLSFGSDGVVTDASASQIRKQTMMSKQSRKEGRSAGAGKSRSRSSDEKRSG